MAVLFGNLLTVANVGDSKAFVDTGSEIVELTTTHRIEDNAGAPRSYCLLSVSLFLLAALQGLTMPAKHREQGALMSTAA